jgi:hypothetical protein
MILFQIYFEVPEDRRGDFERAYAEVFQPALSRQKGFQNARLLRLYPQWQIAEIEGEPTDYNYQINFVFDTEQSRRKWAVSKDHDMAWPEISAIAKRAVWRGFDLV